MAGAQRPMKIEPNPATLYSRFSVYRGQTVVGSAEVTRA